MRKNFGTKSWFYPLPVLIIATYDEAANQVKDKLSKAGFHVSRSEFVDAPVIDEFPLTLDCELLKVSEDGNIPVHNAYLKLGEKVGNAFQDGAKLK